MPQEIIIMNKKIKIILSSDIHYRCADYYGRPKEEIAELLCADLEAEYKKEPYDALLLLGDYSLDHWGWNDGGTYLNHGISNAELFTKKYLGRIAPDGVTVKMIPGNHEQYGEELWHKLTGYHRNDHAVIGDILFILTDTFAGNLDPTEHSDGTYTGANVSDIKELMARYPDKKVVLCSHWFDMSVESEEFRELLRRESRVLCLFCGHNHKSCVDSTGEENGGKPILYTGNYSYSGEKNNVACLPGYRRLLIDEKELSCCYVAPSHRYKIGEVYFTNEYAEQDSVTIKL